MKISSTPLKQITDGYLADGKVTVREMDKFMKALPGLLKKTTYEDRVALANFLINERAKMAPSAQFIAEGVLASMSGDQFLMIDLYAHEADGSLTRQEAKDALVRAGADGLTDAEIECWLQLVAEWNERNPQPATAKAADSFKR